MMPLPAMLGAALSLGAANIRTRAGQVDRSHGRAGSRANLAPVLQWTSRTSGATGQRFVELSTVSSSRKSGGSESG
jgi:hypothetical protein